MPRANPVNQRRKAATAWMVEVNDRGRFITGVLRRSKTNHRGEPTPLTRKDCDRMLDAIKRQQKALDLAGAQIEAIWTLLPKDDD